MSGPLPQGGSPRVVRRLVRGSLVVFPVLAVLFWLGTPLGFWGGLYLAFLLELLPALSVAQIPLVDDQAPIPRVPVYLSSAAMILAIGVGGLLVGRMEVGPSAMGLDPVPWSFLALWAGGLSVAALVVVVIFLVARRLFGLEETALLVRLLPRSKGEKALFIVLSLAAGWGEEMAYRGFLVPVLSVVLGGVWPGALLSSALFGLLHAYQGLLGVGRTALLGLILAASLILTGSLWPAVVAHAILDVVAGVFLGDALVKE